MTPDIDRNPEPNVKYQDLAHIATFFENQHVARYRQLPSDHQVSTWINELFQERYGSRGGTGIQVIINDGWSDVNALATSNGNIYVSRGLLGFVDSVEELQFVLGHEFKHIQEGHFEKLRLATGDFGIARYNEYRADIGSFADVKDDENPYGGLVFLKKLSEIRGSSDKVHGSSMDRLLNLFWTTKLVDLEGLSHETHPLPDFVHRYSGEFLPENLVENYISNDRDRLIRATDRVDELSFHQAALVARHLYPSYCSHRTARSRIVKVEGEILEDIVTRFPGEIQRQGFSSQDSTLLAGFVLAASCGVDISSEQYESPNLSVGFFDEVSRLDSPHSLEAALTNENVERIGFAGVHEKPTISLMGQVADELAGSDYFSNGSFNYGEYAAFAASLSRTVASIFFPDGQDSLSEKFVGQFFISGLVSFTPDDPELLNYRAEFSKYASEMTLENALEESGSTYKNIKVGTRKEDLITLVHNVKPKPTDLSDLYPDMFKYPDESKKATELREYDDWVDQRVAKIIDYTNTHDLDEHLVYAQFREYFLANPTFALPDISKMGTYQSRELLVSRVLDHYLVETSIDNLPDQLLLFRAVFPYNLPHYIVQRTERVINEETREPKSTNFRETLQKLNDSITLEQPVLEKYSFVKK